MIKYMKRMIVSQIAKLKKSRLEKKKKNKRIWLSFNEDLIWFKQLDWIDFIIC